MVCRPMLPMISSTATLAWVMSSTNGSRIWPLACAQARLRFYWRPVILIEDQTLPVVLNMGDSAGHPDVTLVVR
jgi:hypothetical protein